MMAISGADKDSVGKITYFRSRACLPIEGNQRRLTEKTMISKSASQKLGVQ